MSIRVVFFDMGDTLTTILPSWETLYVNVCARHGIRIEHDALVAATRAVFGALDADESRMTYEATEEADQRYYQEINGDILRRAGAPMDDTMRTILEHLQGEFETPAHFHLFPDAIPTLETLCAAGYRLTSSPRPASARRSRTARSTTTRSTGSARDRRNACRSATTPSPMSPGRGRSACTASSLTAMAARIMPRIPSSGRWRKCRGS